METFYNRKQIEKTILDCGLYFQNSINQNTKFFDNDNIESVNQLILFFLELNKFSNEDFLPVINILVNKNIENLERDTISISYINGGLGVAYTLLKVFDMTKNEVYFEKAEILITKSSMAVFNSKYVSDSLFCGRAGVLLLLLKLYDVKRSKSTLDMIDYFSKEIISNAVPFGDGLAWYNPLQFIIQPLCSFGHGAAGIGYVFNILGDYFNHSPFKKIGEKAFIYVNKYCLDNETSLWYDFRRDIETEEEFNFYCLAYKNNNYIPFKAHSLNYSIENGIAGIIFSQIDSYPISNLISIISNNENSFEINLDLFYVLNNQVSQWDNSDNFDFETYLSRVVSIVENSEIHDINNALILISYINKSTCKFNLPQLGLSKNFKAQKSDLFVSNSEIELFLFKNHFPKTNIVLNRIQKKIDANLENSILFPDQYLQHSLEYSVLNDSIKSSILKIFNYENELFKLKYKYKQNCFFHINEMIRIKDRFSELNVSENSFNKLFLTRSKDINSKSIFVSYQDLFNDQKEICMYWKYDSEYGIIEKPLNLMDFISSRFKEGKCIQTNLIELTFYFHLKKEEDLKVFIEESNSNNKKDFIQRLPFLLNYQLRLLIVEGVLEITNKKKINVIIYNFCLNNIYKLFWFFFKRYL